MCEAKKPDWARKRIGRIAKRCVPEVLEAIGRGYLSASTVDKFWRDLSADEQQERLTQLIERKDRDRLRCRVVVEILRAHLASGAKDLHGLRRDLRRAISETAPG
jgi:hypothetical protein